MWIVCIWQKLFDHIQQTRLDGGQERKQYIWGSPWAGTLQAPAGGAAWWPPWRTAWWPAWPTATPPKPAGSPPYTSSRLDPGKMTPLSRPSRDFMEMCQSVTFVKILIQMNVRIYSYQKNYTNEYPNIFILICLTRTNVRISICIENCTNIQIYSNIRLGFTL